MNGYPAWQGYAVILEEAGPSYWGHKVLHLRLQPHQVCSVT